MSGWQSGTAAGQGCCSLIWKGCGISPVTISSSRTPRLKMSIWTAYLNLYHSVVPPAPLTAQACARAQSNSDGGAPLHGGSMS